jgi:hypothetical protein
VAALELPQPLIWDTGPDAAFWGNGIALAIVGALAVGAYFALADATRAARAAGDPPVAR